MQQDIIYGMLNFKMAALAPYELTKRTETYTPLVISINYMANGQYFAFIDYCVFTQDSNKKITGARSLKQIILINGMPFEIKSIFGLTNPDDIDSKNQVKQVQGAAVEPGATVGAGTSSEEAQECTFCMSVPSNTIIMPCGHMCVCLDCGK